jgi:aminomethyltransferase
MTLLTAVHEAHGATFEERGGRQAVRAYRRPARTHAAVRNGVGLIERCADVLVVTGDDRIEYVDNAISNRVPAEEGAGVYALLLTPQGRIRTDMYVYNAGERLLVFVPPGEGDPLAAEWREKTFIQDVEFTVATDDFCVFGVHGPQATEKVASVFSAGTPEQHLTFVRGSMGGTGVTVVRTDALAGEEGYEVVCEAGDGEEIFDTLENRGLNAVPFGYRVWDSLTLEAGTPLFDSELTEAVPNNLGLRNAVDFEKGCFVGQEVVSRVENRGRATKRLVGLAVDAVPETGAAVFAGDESVGTVTRGRRSPTLDRPIALALVDHEVGDRTGEEGALAVRVDGEERAGTVTSLPFVEGSDRSGRLPQY